MAIDVRRNDAEGLGWKPGRLAGGKRRDYRRVEHRETGGDDLYHLAGWRAERLRAEGGDQAGRQQRQQWHSIPERARGARPNPGRTYAQSEIREMELERLPGGFRFCEPV